MDTLQTPHRQPRILVVDDEELVRTMLARLLESKYHCDTTGCTEEALALLDHNEYELVMSDISMPGRDGLDLLSDVRARNPQAVVVMISGLQNQSHTIEALRRGAFDYITKPFRLAEVECGIERALKHQALIEANRRYGEHLEGMVSERTNQLRQVNLKVNEMFEALYINYRATLQALAAALEARDAETEGHSKRVVAYCLRLGRALGLGDREMIALEHGALLHDIGKIGVPDHILLKRARLTPDEWELMRRHIDFGVEIIRGIEFLYDATPVITQHHEKWDGTGYPLGLKGEEISLNARIFAVADAVDAITSDRPYRAGNSFEAAAEELRRCAGHHFDPRVVETFLSVPIEEWKELRASVINDRNWMGENQLSAVRTMIFARRIEEIGSPSHRRV